jgi:hypothetical protein
MKYRGSDALTARQDFDSERRSFLKNAFAVGGGAGATLDAGGTVVSSASAEDGTSAGRPITAGRRRQRAWVGVNFCKRGKTRGIQVDRARLFGISRRGLVSGRVHR